MLRSILRTAVAMLDPGETRIDLAHLPDDLIDELQHVTDQAPPDIPTGKLAEISRAAIQRALQNANGNLSAAARRLGISRQTLYRKLK